MPIFQPVEGKEILYSIELLSFVFLPCTVFILIVIKLKWFRQKLIFNESHPVENKQLETIGTTGSYRITSDFDSFVDIQRPTSLPPVKLIETHKSKEHKKIETNSNLQIQNKSIPSTSKSLSNNENKESKEHRHHHSSNKTKNHQSNSNHIKNDRRNRPKSLDRNHRSDKNKTTTLKDGKHSKSTSNLHEHENKQSYFSFWKSKQKPDQKIVKIEKLKEQNEKIKEEEVKFSKVKDKKENKVNVVQTPLTDETPQRIEESPPQDIGILSKKKTEKPKKNEQTVEKPSVRFEEVKTSDIKNVEDEDDDDDMWDLVAQHRRSVSHNVTKVKPTNNTKNNTATLLNKPKTLRELKRNQNKQAEAITIRNQDFGSDTEA